MSIKIIVQIVIVALLSLIGISKVHALTSTSAKATIVVVDEQGVLMEGANVSIIFEKNKRGDLGIEIYPVQGITNAEGKFTAEHDNDNGVIAYNVNKKGFYRSIAEYRYSRRALGRWEPWDPELKIVMRKIEKPVPMYARNTKMSRKRIEIPVVGKDVGFDLIEYDWVPPYGKGKHSDFIFHLESRFSGNRDYDFTLTLQFNNGNGIQSYTEDLNQGSIFKLPRFAPEDSYMNALEIYTRHIPGGQLDRTLDENKHYIFRVRAVVEDNRVTEALYGKILGDINVRPQKDGKAKVDFTYYLNPDGTRNLEFDPSRNLFIDLTDLERVGIK